MLYIDHSAPKAAPLVACDVCGDRIYNLAEGVFWLRPADKEKKQPASFLYFAHPGACFDKAARLLGGRIGRGPLLVPLKRMAPRLVRGYEVPADEGYDILELVADGAVQTAEPDLDGPCLQPESAASHSLQLRVLWGALQRRHHQSGHPPMNVELVADEVWASPCVVARLVEKTDGPRRHPLEAWRLFRFLYEEASAAGLLPLREGRVQIE